MDKHSPTPRPESVQNMLLMWLGVVAGEALHLIFSVVMSVLNRNQLMAQARQTAEDAAKEGEEAMSDAMVSAIGYGSLALSTLISLSILVLLSVMLWLLRKNGKSAGMARRLWFFFSLYFGLRIIIVFMTSPGGSDIPDWLFFLDGCVQLLVGVAAVLGLIFSTREPTLEYTGEMEQMRQLQKEMAQQRREAEAKAREEEEKEKREQQAKRRAERRAGQREEEDSRGQGGGSR
ncbi:hypothetical protein [Corynebacterium sp.]|uniref:hypothetical protein n=1 Tax=Corynebacterium sp. TaxID=1720 RepID=UPI0026DBFFF0|nr:hypothetical protein [Corynebacterium sp.]MDO5033109.1 hypothetical protein [Corynebacterium sp.]